MTEPALFAAKPDSVKTLQEKYAKTVAPVISKVGANRLTPEQMKQCLLEGAGNSGFGRFVLANNYWMLPGRGDVGSFYSVRINRDYSDPSGYKPVIQQFAKFSSVAAAVDAWCKSKGR